MNDMSEKDLTFLPVGSVVKLKGGKANLVIIGFSPLEPGKDVVWDYLGAIWPMGVMSSDRNLLFNRDQIEEVVFKSFSNEKEIEFRTKLEQAVDLLRKI